AKKVAHKLGIPHYVMNFRDIFAQRVIADFCQEYSLGRTPNPCIRCNQYANAYGDGCFMNMVRQELTLNRAQQFAVVYLVEPGPLQAAGQDHGGGYHRAGQRTPPGFINASNKSVALFCQLLFFS
ncbi:unnamed protein product, partial [marine sediment metagenome]